MSEVLRASRRIPLVNEDYAKRVREEVRDRFARELMQALTERGGIVGPIHEQSVSRDDWLFGTGPFVEYTVYANVTDMPEPEQYRLMGGPADGRIVFTAGAPSFRVPTFPPLTGAPYDVAEPVLPTFAEYERQGDTQVYLFRRMA